MKVLSIYKIPCIYFERFGIDPLSVADNVEYVTSDPLLD